MGSLYSEERSWLHAAPAGFKLLALALLGTALFLIDSLVGLAAGSFLCAAVYASLGRAGRGAHRMVLMVLLVAAVLVAFHALLGQAAVGAASALRLLGSSFLGVSLTLTTRYTEWLPVFERLLSPLARLGWRVGRLGLQMALMLRFTDIFFVQWKRLDDAHRLRTGKPGGLRLIAPMTIQMLLAARRVADTLRVRLSQ